MRTFLSPPYLNGQTEQSLMAEVFASNYIAPCGPMVDQFETEFARGHGFSRGLATTGASMALTLIYRHLGVGPGDVVICADLTFVASIAPAVTMGAQPVFVDCEAQSWTLDPVLLQAALQAYPQAKAVVAVDLYGQTCDYDALDAICQAAGVPLIIDAAESVGATYRGRPAGAAGYAAVYSFNGNKIITSGGGGMLLSHDQALMDDARNLSMQAREPLPWYEHTRVGYNCRMSNVIAAIGLGQYRHLEQAVADKRRIYDTWQRLFADLPVTLMPEAPWGISTHWLTVILLPQGIEPMACVQALDAIDIEARPLWKPMHLQPCFCEAPCFGGAVSETLFATGLCLPSGRSLDEATMVVVVNTLKAILQDGESLTESDT